MTFNYDKLDEKLYSEDKKSYEINKTSNKDNLITIAYDQNEIKANFSFLVGVFGELDNYSDNNQDYIKLTLDEEIIFGNTDGKLEIQSKTNYDIEIIFLKKFNKPFDDQNDNLSSYIYQIKINNIDPTKEIKEIKLQLSSTGDYKDICLGFQKDSATFYSNNINILRNSINPNFDKNVYNLSDEDNKLINNYLFDDFSDILRAGEKIKLSFKIINDGKSNFIVNFSCIGPYTLNILINIDLKTKNTRLNDSYLDNSYLRGDYNGTSNASLSFLKENEKYTVNIFLNIQKVYFEFIDSSNSKQSFNFTSKILTAIMNTKDKFDLNCSINSREAIDTIMYFKYFQTLKPEFYYLGTKSLSKDFIGICSFDGDTSLYSKDNDFKEAFDIELGSNSASFRKIQSIHNRSVLYSYRRNAGNDDFIPFKFNLDFSKLKKDNKYKYEKFYITQAYFMNSHGTQPGKYTIINDNKKNIPNDNNRICFIIYEFDMINLKVNVKYTSIKEFPIVYTDVYSVDLKDNDNNLFEIHDYSHTDWSNNYYYIYDFGLIITKDKPEFFLDGFINNFRYPLIDGKFYNGELELIGLQNTKESV